MQAACLKETVAVVDICDTMRIRIIRDYAKTENAYKTETTVTGRFETIEHTYDSIEEAWSYVASKVMLANGE